MKKPIFLALCIAVLSYWVAPSQAQMSGDNRAAPRESRESLLNRLKTGKRYDEMLLVLFPTIRKDVSVNPLTQEEQIQDFIWLRSVTAVPPPNNVDFPLYYFYSWKLASADIYGSRYHNARGRIRLMLDASLCKKNSSFSAPWNLIVEGGVFDHKKMRAEKEWLLAVDDAINWHAKAIDPFDNKDWYCGPQNSIPSSEIVERYRGTLEKIREANLEKLKQYAP